MSKLSLKEYIEKQQSLLDNIPSEESRNIIVCEDCGEFIYLQPVTNQGECKGCGLTITMEERQRL